MLILFWALSLNSHVISNFACLHASSLIYNMCIEVGKLTCIVIENYGLSLSRVLELAISLPKFVIAFLAPLISYIYTKLNHIASIHVEYVHAWYCVP